LVYPSLTSPQNKAATRVSEYNFGLQKSLPP
jgi:hypothetical protein